MIRAAIMLGAMTSKFERAVLAGGCFWGMQDLLRRYPGVLSTRVGYSGGDVPDATYHNHGTHAEAIEIVFDPLQISYRQILEFFFQIHDPTTKKRQGNDMGASYRSAIFYLGDERRMPLGSGGDFAAFDMRTLRPDLNGTFSPHSTALTQGF